MEKHKELYEAPAALVCELMVEAVICESGNAGLQDYNWHNLVEE